tara:strand:- start:910 stop:1113 length:204 start_codon:yes stop_codon:yes gene_type:complete
MKENKNTSKRLTGWRVDTQHSSYLFRFIDDIIDYYKIEDVGEINKIVKWDDGILTDRTDKVLSLLNK